MTQDSICKKIQMSCTDSDGWLNWILWIQTAHLSKELHWVALRTKVLGWVLQKMEEPLFIQVKMRALSTFINLSAVTKLSKLEMA